MKVTARVTFAACSLFLCAIAGAEGTLGAQSPAPAALAPKPLPAAPGTVAPPAVAPGAHPGTAPNAAQGAPPVAAPGTPGASPGAAPPGTPSVLEAPVLAPDKGDFKLTYEKTANPSYKELQALFKGSHLFEETLKALNATLALPRDLPVVLRECGATDARYEPQLSRLSVCYELVDALATLFASQARTQEEAEQAGVAVAGATLFVFLQETGRALLDLWAIPPQGRPEDQVDQLATLILLASGEEGEQTAINGAQAFLGEQGKPGSRAQLAALAYWKAHPLDGRRLDDIFCWVYGKNPAKFQDLVGDGTLSAERAERCPGDFQSLSQTWEPLLAPFLKKRPGADAPSPP